MKLKRLKKYQAGGGMGPAGGAPASPQQPAAPAPAGGAEGAPQEDPMQKLQQMVTQYMSQPTPELADETIKFLAELLGIQPAAPAAPPAAPAGGAPAPVPTPAARRGMRMAYRRGGNIYGYGGGMKKYQNEGKVDKSPGYMDSTQYKGSQQKGMSYWTRKYLEDQLGMDTISLSSYEVDDFRRQYTKEIEAYKNNIERRKGRNPRTAYNSPKDGKKNSSDDNTRAQKFYEEDHPRYTDAPMTESGDFANIEFIERDGFERKVDKSRRNPEGFESPFHEGKEMFNTPRYMGVLNDALGEETADNYHSYDKGVRNYYRKNKDSAAHRLLKQHPKNMHGGMHAPLEWGSPAYQDGGWNHGAYELEQSYMYPEDYFNHEMDSHMYGGSSDMINNRAMLRDGGRSYEKGGSSKKDFSQDYGALFKQIRSEMTPKEKKRMSLYDEGDQYDLREISPRLYEKYKEYGVDQDFLESPINYLTGRGFLGYEGKNPEMSHWDKFKSEGRRAVDKLEMGLSGEGFGLWADGGNMPGGYGIPDPVQVGQDLAIAALKRRGFLEEDDDLVDASLESLRDLRKQGGRI